MKPRNTCPKSDRHGALRLRAILLSALAAATFLIASPQEPVSSEGLRLGQPFRIFYGIPGYGFGGRLVDAEGLHALVHTDLMSPPTSLPMTEKNGIWETSFTLTDSTVTMILLSFAAVDSAGRPMPGRIDNNLGRYWDILVVDPSGRPIRGAFEARAVSYTGYGSKRTEDLERAVSEIDEELRHFPDNYSARMTGYTILLKQDAYAAATRRQISRDIELVMEGRDDEAEAVNFAVGAYRMIGENEKAAHWEDVHLRLNPRSSQAARKAFEEIMRIQEPDSRIERLRAFRVEYHDSPMAEIALSATATVAIEMGTTDLMLETGDALLAEGTTPAAASGLAGIAGVFAQKAEHLQEAEAYIRDALHLIRAGSRPPQVPAEDWAEKLSATEARYRDILGWTLFQQGQVQPGLQELKAAGDVLSQPGIYYHLAKALESAGDTEEALLQYARAAAFGGDIADTAVADLETLWERTQKIGDIDAFLAEQAGFVNALYRDKILAKQINRPAPDFELEDHYGDWIRLSDQRGSVTLLCFWASWSESSTAVLQELKKLSVDFGHDVLFLTVTVDVEDADVRAFIREHRLRFPVMHSSGTDRDYELQGVPTIFVIDADGNIRFEHRGYRPDIRRVLAVELEALL